MLKTLNLQTFTLNPPLTDEKQKMIIDLIKQMDNGNLDLVGEAFIRIMEDKKSYITTAALSQ